MNSRRCERQFSNVERSLESVIRNKVDENVPDDRQEVEYKSSFFFLE